jgi:Zn-finger protein
VDILYRERGAAMWESVCQNCGWASGEAYLKSVVDSIGKVHEQDYAGHKVVTKEVSTFASDFEGKEDSERQGPGPSKP